MQPGRRRLLALLATAPLLPLAPGAPRADEVPAELMPDMGFPYTPFDRLEQSPVEVGGARLQVAFAAGGFALPKEAFLAWVKRAGEAVATYYSRFPVRTARILLLPVAGERVRGGTTWGYRGAASRLMVGTGVGEAALRDDWVLVHEMIHMALPELDPRHAWLSEGIAVYVESIARVQAGQLPERQIWGDFVRAMPKGLPEPGDQGYDNTGTWGRTYWGGAIFCLLADLQIRERSGNRIGLQTALRGINALADHTQEWPIRRVLAAGDEATGLDVLMSLYEAMRDKPVTTDLPALWRDLGVAVSGPSVTLDPQARLASLRMAITRPL